MGKFLTEAKIIKPVTEAIKAKVSKERENKKK